jgi:hypothetical protein
MTVIGTSETCRLLVYVKGSNSEFAFVLRTNRKGSAMKRFLTGFLIAVFMLAPVMAEQVPFATPPSDRNPSESAVGTLANIMATIQLRHIKLWFVGKAKNWDLLNYEAKKLEDEFIAAALFYRNLRIDNVLLVNKPLERLMEAAKKNDYSLYTKAFDELTAGCNSCHVAGQVGYIHIQLPKSSPFSDQSYER